MRLPGHYTTSKFTVVGLTQVVGDDTIALHPMMNLTPTADCRMLDGAQEA